MEFLRNVCVQPNDNGCGVFSNSKPRIIPKFWYPLTAGIIGIWVIFSYFLI